MFIKCFSERYSMLHGFVRVHTLCVCVCVCVRAHILFYMFCDCLSFLQGPLIFSVSFNYTLWSARTANTLVDKFFKTRFGLLAWISWSILISESQILLLLKQIVVEVANYFYYYYHYYYYYYFFNLFIHSFIYFNKWLQQCY